MKKSVKKVKSNVQMMKDFVAKGVSDSVIKASFTRRYKARGQNDPVYIAKRVAIYKKIALGLYKTA